MVQEKSEEESKENEEVVTEKEVQVTAEEEMGEVDLGSVPQGPRPILISVSLTEMEKAELVLLLKEFKDVFAWEYNEMPGLDPRLVAHTLNVDQEARPITQPARTFHMKIEGQIIKKYRNCLPQDSLSLSNTHDGYPTLCP